MTVLVIVAPLLAGAVLRGSGVAVSTGKKLSVRWVFKTNGQVHSTPSVLQSVRGAPPSVLVGSEDGKLYALDGRSGKVNWTFDASSRVGCCTPAIGDIFGKDRPGVVIASVDKGLFGLDALTAAKAWQSLQNKAFVASPTLDDVNGDGSPEAVIGSSDGTVFCVDASSGVPVWSYPVGKQVSARLAVGRLTAKGAQQIAFGSLDGRVYCVAGESGRPVWTRTLDSPVNSSPAIGNILGGSRNSLVIGSQRGFVYALDGESGATIWSFRMGDSGPGPRLVDLDGDGALEAVLSSGDASVYALSGRSGRLRWKFRMNGPALTQAPPSVCPADKPGKWNVVVCTDTVYVVNGETGKCSESLVVASGRVLTGAAVADLDGDGNVELAVGCDDGRVFVLGH